LGYEVSIKLKDEKEKFHNLDKTSRSAKRKTLLPTLDLPIVSLAVQFLGVVKDGGLQ
jgi:hypothetical protein